jgi:hypothetical protein
LAGVGGTCFSKLPRGARATVLVLSSALMVRRDNGTETSPSSDVPTWRPTVQSYQNLSLFTSTLAVSAGLVLALTYSLVLVLAVAGLVLAAAAALSLLITRRRVQECPRGGRASRARELAGKCGGSKGPATCWSQAVRSLDRDGGRRRCIRRLLPDSRRSLCGHWCWRRIRQHSDHGAGQALRSSSQRHGVESK